MAVSITASLTGAAYPQKVSVVVSGLTAGDNYEVAGVWSGGSWPVRGGTGVSDGSQLVLADVAGPINVPVTYQVVADSGSAASSPVAVVYDGRWLLQSLDGSRSSGFSMLANGLPRAMPRRGGVLEVAGRTSPVPLTRLPLMDTGSITVRVTPSQETDLRSVLSDGRPVLLRTDASLVGVPASDFIVVTGVDGHSEGVGSAYRVWSLTYQVIGDPEPSTVVPLSTWDDFDATYAALTWSSFDTEWAGLTWDLFDTTDWTTH